MAPVIAREPRSVNEGRFWRRAVRRAGADRVLDLGCGGGRVARHLAVHARRVVGIDLSPDMLDMARRRTGAEPALALVRGDLRRLPVRSGWDLAVAADGVFGHLLGDADRRRGLEEIARALAPSGWLLLEGLWLSDPIFRKACRDGWRRTRPLARPGDDGLEVVRELWRCDPETRVCRARFAYGPREGGDRISARCRVRVWGEAELDRIFPAAGLRIRRRRGDYRGGEFSPRDSTRLIVEAERR